MTHEEYLDEPAAVVAWTLKFAEMDAQIEADELKEEADKAKRRRQ